MSKAGNFAAVVTMTIAIGGQFRALSSAEKIPVLLELFTSEGCSSCPPADRLLASLDEKQPVPDAELIVLSEHVDYFNYLGWKDPFSSPEFTARQEAASRRSATGEVYTPQLVVDGRSGFTGSDEKRAMATIQSALREPKIPIGVHKVVRDRGNLSARVESTGQPGLKISKADLYIAVADDRRVSEVRRGENSGRTLTHVAVARTLRLVGTINVRERSTIEIRIPLQSGWGGNGLRVIVFIEDPASGHVLGVAYKKIDGEFPL
jgi:hypothetical protein